MVDRPRARRRTPPAATSGARPRIVLASARKIDIGDPKDVKRTLAGREDWMELARTYFHTVGELKHCANIIGDALSRLRVYAADSLEDDATAEPPETMSPAAREPLDRIRPFLREILTGLGIHLTITGESHLIGVAERANPQDPDSEPIPENWFVVSSFELEQKGKQVFVKDPESGDAIRLYGADDQDRPETQEPDFWARIWRPDRFAASKADSPTRGILDACEDLLIAGRYFRSVARSRISMGELWYVPDDISWGNTDPTTDSAGDQEGEDDPLNQEFMDYFTVPVSDEGSAAAVAPGLMRGPRREGGSGIEQHRVSRQTDEFMLRWYEAAQKRFAQGINLPVEFVFGLGEANHWGAGQIEESAFRQYLEPVVILAIDGLTRAYYRPALRDSGTDPNRQLLWFDASQLVIDKEKRGTAIDAHQAYLISDEATRRTLRYGEDDAPDAAEIERRILQDQARRGSAPTAVQIDPASITPAQASVTAAVVRAAILDTPTLGRRLAAIDRDLKARLETLLDSTVRRALEHAGNQLRNRARKDRAITASLRNVDADLVAATLGRQIVAALAPDDMELVRTVIDQTAGRFDRLIAGAQTQALRLVPGLTDHDIAEARALQTQDRTDAWTWLRAQLLDLAVQRLYDPNPAAPADGETDSDTTVPFSLVREVCARAGGAQRAGADTTLAVGLIRGAIRALGVATGYLMRRLFRDVGVQVEGYQWEYGPFARSRPFEPHAALDGVQFETFEDDVLLNTFSFPADTYFMPGDHAGCKCDAIPILIERSNRSSPPADEEPPLEDELVPVAASATRRGG